MVKVISQDTFDAVVKENIEEFEMSRAEAIQEAKDQFISQGVDLSNIVIFEGDNDELANMLDSLKACQSISGNEEKIKLHSESLKTFLNKGLAEKTLATSLGAYDILVTLLSNTSSAKEPVLMALASLLDGNPDPLNVTGLESVNDSIRNGDPLTQKAAYEVLLNVCVRHEYNRQNVFRSGILSQTQMSFNEFPIEISRLWQALVQDDDVRVPYGKAHDHAREIVEDLEALTLLTNKLKDLKDSEDISLLMSCLSSLSVRNEYCQKVADEGGLEIIFKILVNPDQDKNVIKEALKLIKTLSGNDHVKREVGNTAGIPIIVNSIAKNMKNKAICKFGCASLTALSLRSPENAKQIVECGGDGIIVQIMKTHKDTSQIVISASNAVRNIVSRSREYSSNFVDLDIEDLLNEALRQFSNDPNSVSSLKAALRDLGLEVRLEEQWKGVKGSLESSS